ncbi:hypothetical protein [Nonomuraea zeae]|uniref:WD40 repeat domain-containing protein n=1 Tax=Nonomuraea zeae TaxID=1642303 RepID=A0A5S4GVH5_9ACTN|nr:hypothetical protein [Nonomuraea zeae]TMR36967.1 hypothetical protein ETD85_09460 [Nonomuraea zeae]
MRITCLLAGACLLATFVASSESDEQWEPVTGLEFKSEASLSALLAFGRDQVWVGGSGDGKPLLARWDGARWIKKHLAGEYTVDTIAGTGPADLWIASAGEDPSTGDGVASQVFRWDGSRWRDSSWFSAANLAVHGIAVDGDRVTLAGSDNDRPSSVMWDGRQAVLVGGRPGLFGSVAAQAGQVWIAGAKPEESCKQAFPAIWHRARPGAPFEEVALPAVPDGYLNAIAVRGPSDVWAVGAAGWAGERGYTIGADPEVFCPGQGGGLESKASAATSPPSQLLPLVMHGDGKAWRQMKLPSWQGTLLDVAVSPRTGVWVAGADFARAGEVMILHYDGVWTREYVRTGDLYGLELAVVDGVPWIAGGVQRPFVMRRSR